MEPWWTNQAAGWVGGGLGGVIGLLGAALGVVAGRGAATGRGRPAVMVILAIMLGLGGFCLVAGIVALILGQPYHVWYPTALIGAISTLVSGVNAPIILKRYKQAEARRLDAQEIRRG